jgi:imidazolonepropionase-like amidohydrolase
MYLLQNATIVDARQPEPRAGHVLVEGGTIKEVSDVPIDAADATIFDLRGRTLLPGLTDAHVHITAISLDLSELERSPQSLIALAAGQILNDMVMRGFTTVRDAGGADFGHVEAVRRGLIVGPRLLISGRALSQTGGHGDLRPRGVGGETFCACHAGKSSFATIVDGVDNVRRAAREELRRGANQIKIMASGGVASPADPVWTLQFAEEEIRAVVAEAASWRTYVMAHAFTPEAISRAVRFGVRSIEHGNLIDRDTARLMAEKGAFIVPTLATAKRASGR